MEKFLDRIAVVARMVGARGGGDGGDIAAGAGAVVAAVLLSIADSQDTRWGVGGCRGFADPWSVVLLHGEQCADRRVLVGGDRSH